MAGIASNAAALGVEEGIGGTNYDYLQHTTIHPQPNPPPQQIGYYPQQPHEASPYSNNHHQHQYYHQQQQYYQPTPNDLPQQQEPWANPHRQQHPDGHYHSQYYGQQQPQQQYHQNQNYHQQPHPIHQLSTFVNHSHNPQSPPPAMYPNSTSAPPTSAGHVTSPSPQRSISPARPGPGSSPGAASNHMMPVRLQNMGKGARTKAGMRKLIQMQAQQEGQNPQIPPSPNTNTKKARSKKAQMQMAEEKASAPSGKSSVEDAAVFVSSPGKSMAGNSNSHSRTPSPRGSRQDRLQKSKTPPSSPSKLKGVTKGQEPSSSNTASPKPKSDPNPGLVHPLLANSSRPVTIENVDPFYQGQKPLYNPIASPRAPKPSDVLFEKLGLDKEKKTFGQKRPKPDRQAQPPPPPAPPQVEKPIPKSSKTRRDSCTTPSSSDQSGSEDPVEDLPVVETVRRSRRNYSGSTDTTEDTVSSIKSSPSIRSPSPPPPPKRKKAMPKSKQIEEAAAAAAKQTPNTRKATPISPTPTPTSARSAKETPSADFVVEPKPKRKYTKRKLSTAKNDKIPQSKVDFTPPSISIPEVAAAIVQPGSGSPAKSAVEQVQTAESAAEVRTKRKYVRRKPLKSQLALQDLQLTQAQTPTTTAVHTPRKYKKRKKATTDEDSGQVSVGLPIPMPTGLSVTPLQSPLLTKIKSEKATPSPKNKPIKGKKLSKAAARSQKINTSTDDEDSESEEPISPKLTIPNRQMAIDKRVSHGPSEWIEAGLEKKRENDAGKMKKPTIFAKGIILPQGGAIDAKKEPGPSLKVRHGAVKFYRGSVEEDVDEAYKKLDITLKDNVAVTKDCDDDSPWVCIFCGLGPHDMRLGDLFGPYYVNLPSEEKLHSESCKTEVWVHSDCALWAGNVILVGSTLRNLDEAVYEAGKVVCNVCQNVGATIGCLKRGCKETAHFPCAKINDWSLNGDTFRSHCSAHLAEVQKKG